VDVQNQLGRVEYCAGALKFQGLQGQEPLESDLDGRDTSINRAWNVLRILRPLTDDPCSFRRADAHED
jgi:hypothetical protein